MKLTDLQQASLIILSIMRIRKEGETSVAAVRNDGKDLGYDLDSEEIMRIIAKAHKTFREITALETPAAS